MQGPAGVSAVTLPSIEIVQETPIQGSGVPIDKVPGTVRVIDEREIARTNSSNVVDVLQQRVPNVTVNQATGNTFQPEVEYRGFSASPLTGTPQGLAVYQNGVRINEAFGDAVNWDLIPTTAIRGINVMTNNPAFGLNALGGALNIEMKNGFNTQGGGIDVRAGSHGRIYTGLEWGQQSGNWGAFISLEGVNDNGWRDNSQSAIRRGYFDLGYKAERAEFHWTVSGAANRFGAAAATPIQMLQQRWQSIYTIPQTTNNKLFFTTLTGSVAATDTWTIDGNVYWRTFAQTHVDGNTTEAQACDPADVNAGFLCYGDNATLLNGLQIADPSNGGQLGQIDRTRTTSTSVGGTLQATNRDTLWGRDNVFIVGSSLDFGFSRFGADSELGTIGPDLFVSGTGIAIDMPGGPVGPVRLQTRNNYVGLYALDTINVTKEFAVTAGGRLNWASIQLNDQIGTALNGNQDYFRFNPVLGATYKFTDELSAYAGYSEANRTPTPLELGCADPNRPCIIDSFLVSDPPLKQIISRTAEIGLRGKHDLKEWGTVSWSLGAFHTTLANDIIQVPSEISGFGYYQNSGQTLRQGVEATIAWTADKWSVYANLGLLDATYRTPLLLSSPNNPYADADGQVFVAKGNHVPGIPGQRLTMGFDYNITPEWKVGADAVFVGSQYLIGDAGNQDKKLGGYGTMNLHTSYKFNKMFEAYLQVDNLFDRHYATSGTYFGASDIAFLNLTNPRTLNPAATRGIYGGVKVKF
ncbi:MAG: TonB-dependent receptor [Alsobacter sp.]